MAGAPTDAASALKNSARRTAWLTWVLELDIEILLQTVEPLDKLKQVGPLGTPTSICSTVFCDTWLRWGRLQIRVLRILSAANKSRVCFGEKTTTGNGHCAPQRHGKKGVRRPRGRPCPK